MDLGNGARQDTAPGRQWSRQKPAGSAASWRVEEREAPGRAGAPTGADFAEGSTHLADREQEDQPRHGRRDETQRTERREHEGLQRDEQDADPSRAESDEAEQQDKPRPRGVAALPTETVENDLDQVRKRA